MEKFAREWFGTDEEVSEGGKRTRMPRGVIPALAVVMLSLMLCVCATVMVSRAAANVSSLEDRIEDLTDEINDLEGKLEVKNTMLDIKRIATEEYGMISAEYASHRYLDIRDVEVIKKHETSAFDESWLSELLRAIGLLE